MMEKEECFSKAIAYTIIALPIVAIVILVVYIFGFVAIPKDKTTYDFIKDHGSLIAGIIGIIGVFILIWNQNKTSRDMIESNMLVMRNESLEAKKISILEDVYKIGYKFQALSADNGKNFADWKLSTSFGLDYFKDIKVPLYRLESFIQANLKRENITEMAFCLACIKDFVRVYEKKLVSYLELTVEAKRLLGSMENLDSLKSTDFMMGHDFTYEYYDVSRKECVIDSLDQALVAIQKKIDGEILRPGFISIGLSGYLASYLSFTVLPSLIKSINSMKE